MLLKYDTFVKDILQRTHDVKSFRFPRPSDFVFKPGQFMFVTIKDGQDEIKKHFSISSSPSENEYLEITKKLTGNRFSNALNSIKLGSWARIEGPYGAFFFEGEYEKIGMLTGGIGITPIMSICRYCADMKAKTDMVLLYSNHTAKDIAFRSELEELKAQNKGFKLVLSMTDSDPSWNGSTGRIDSGMIKKEIPDFEERMFFISGPTVMVLDLRGILEGMGIQKGQIKQDLFTGFETNQTQKSS